MYKTTEICVYGCWAADLIDRLELLDDRVDSREAIAASEADGPFRFLSGLIRHGRTCGLLPSHFTQRRWTRADERQCRGDSPPSGEPTPRPLVSGWIGRTRLLADRVSHHHAAQRRDRAQELHSASTPALACVYV